LSVDSDLFKQTEDLLKRNPSAADLAEFEKTAAARVLASLKGVGTGTAR
ncbi:MAG: hypothetical protein IMZ44_24160, partial [Planctomycetes bacterium]|nr:hypothetical protein [Planctomycetota bacterium]